MARPRGAAIYRVCATAVDRWGVFQHPGREPVASFDDKNAALSYALCLARGKVGWELLFASRTSSAPNGFGFSSRISRC